MLTLKQLAKQLQGDYIPNGKKVSAEEFRKMKFRRTRDSEVYRCGMVTGYDPQSTHIYCGRVAEWVHFTNESVIALCNRADHAPRLEQREERNNPVVIQLPDGPTVILP